MQIWVAPIASGLKQQENYEKIPRDRWANWREELRQRQRKDGASPQPRQPPQAKNPNKRKGYTSPPTIPEPISDSYAGTLFCASLLTAR